MKGVKKKGGYTDACEAANEVAAVKGDRARLCQRRLMGSTESLFSRGNEVRLPEGGRGIRMWRTGWRQTDGRTDGPTRWVRFIHGAFASDFARRRL